MHFFLRANHVPYMTKTLCKAIMRRYELEIKYLKNVTIENKAKYKKQKNSCSNSIKRSGKKFIQTQN